jgi:photosynthetic reaction center M subunit
MAQYQNIFHQVQVRGPVEFGVPARNGLWPRQGQPFFSYWLGKIGDAQIGPIHLGTTGFLSIVCGVIAIEIIGLNMLASVNWSPFAGCSGFRSNRLSPSTD